MVYSRLSKRFVSPEEPLSAPYSPSPCAINIGPALRARTTPARSPCSARPGNPQPGNVCRSEWSIRPDSLRVPQRYVGLAILSGLRRSELFALRWQDVDQES